ncbi:hypothetical protein F4820DRAFT_402030 [Hypoxylon rubiginosum]|uniref:Uncharacterized protein n=1 Tax=Hypoxylon rubiginosum TaxID=110542 RepID=A0ACB9ZJH5_9PEZI|nr:hypothetical protein F4820DRAFT_402030 [Hypoxylon rubiginosum]
MDHVVAETSEELLVSGIRAQVSVAGEKGRARSSHGVGEGCPAALEPLHFLHETIDIFDGEVVSERERALEGGLAFGGGRNCEGGRAVGSPVGSLAVVLVLASSSSGDGCLVLVLPDHGLHERERVGEPDVESGCHDRGGENRGRESEDDVGDGANEGLDLAVDLRHDRLLLLLLLVLRLGGMLLLLVLLLLVDDAAVQELGDGTECFLEGGGSGSHEVGESDDEDAKDEVDHHQQGRHNDVECVGVDVSVGHCDDGQRDVPKRTKEKKEKETCV